MKYIFLGFIILSISANATILEPRTGVFPLEFELLLKFAQKYANEGEQKRIVNIIRVIDTEGHKLTQEELMFVTKTEVYKSILKSENNNPISLNFNYTALSIELKNARLKYKNSAFLLWLINALAYDLIEISESSSFKDLMLIKKSGHELSPEFLKVDRKLFLITKLALEFTTAAEATPPASIIKKSLRTLENVQTAFLILTKYGRTAPAQTTQLAPGAFHYFTEKSEQEKPTNNAQPNSKGTANEKSIDQILAPVIEGKNQDLPKPVTEKDWVPSESNKKDLPKPVNDTEWLPDN